MFREDHALHIRRGSGNRVIGLALIGFVVLIFGVTVVKLSTSGPVQGFDHTIRPELAVPAE